MRQTSEIDRCVTFKSFRLKLKSEEKLFLNVRLNFERSGVSSTRKRSYSLLIGMASVPKRPPSRKIKEALRNGLAR
jgi:hypothetical protein